MPSSVSSHARKGSGASSGQRPVRRTGTARAGEMRREVARRGSKALDGLGRWFGVKGDEEDLRFRQEQYIAQQTRRGSRHASRRTSGRASSLTPAQMATLNNAEDGDSDEEDAKLRTFDPSTSDCELTRNVDEGMEHYQWLREEELNKIVKPGWFGGEVNVHRDSVVEGLELKGRRASKHRRQSRFRRNTVVQAQLLAAPTYKPWFIDLISFLQFLICIMMLAYAYTEGEIADFALQPQTQTCDVNNANAPCTLYNGTIVADTVTSESNFLYGPTIEFLISLGARYALCMRDDENFLANARRDTALECGSGRDNPCETGAGYGCCSSSTFGAGMMTEAECTAADASAIWTDELCDETTQNIVIRPCCGTSLDGECLLMTESRCLFLNGNWQRNQQLCSKTMCLSGVCRMRQIGVTVKAKDDPPNIPDNPNQWFRLFTSLMVHAGAIQMFVLLFIQLYIGRSIERRAGSLRVALIYLISGVGGNLIAGIFAPYDVTTGCDPALYGLLGVMLVELFQSWQIVEHPYRELAKVGGLCFILIFIGTFPFLDNWSHIGGFLFGIVCAIVFIPYIFFGRWDLARKRLLILICMPLLAIMLISAFVTFYVIQNTNFCTWCHYLNCIPYHSELPCSGESYY